MAPSIVRRALLILRKRRPSIINLPPEVLDIIFSFLQTIWQGCLALSCKRFYNQFQYIFKEAMFRFPYSDAGIDLSIDLKARQCFLSNLQSPTGFWSYFWSRRWIYCDACVKLHPRNEFEFNSYHNTGRYALVCMWPGYVVLCPCLKFSPKRFMPIAIELNKAKLDGDLLLKHIPNWHECKFESPCKRLSYQLAISASLTHSKKCIIFDFTYLVFIDKNLPYKGGRKVMLCPHHGALRSIEVHGSLAPKSFQCSNCEITYAISSSIKPCSNEILAYEIQFKRRFSLLGDPWPGFTDKVDYTGAYLGTRYVRPPLDIPFGIFQG